MKLSKTLISASRCAGETKVNRVHTEEFEERVFGFVSLLFGSDSAMYPLEWTLPASWSIFCENVKNKKSDLFRMKLRSTKETVLIDYKAGECFLFRIIEEDGSDSDFYVLSLCQLPIGISEYHSFGVSLVSDPSKIEVSVFPKEEFRFKIKEYLTLIGASVCIGGDSLPLDFNPFWKQFCLNVERSVVSPTLIMDEYYQLVANYSNRERKLHSSIENTTGIINETYEQLFQLMPELSETLMRTRASILGLASKNKKDFIWIE